MSKHLPFPVPIAKHIASYVAEFAGVTLDTKGITSQNLFNFGLAIIAECLKLYEILTRCANQMHTRYGITDHRSFQELHNRVVNNNLSVYQVAFSSRRIGVFNLSFIPSEHHSAATGPSPDAKKVCYIENLAIDPKYQRQKVGSWCLQDIEQIALKNECSVLRLDCPEKHPLAFKIF